MTINNFTMSDNGVNLLKSFEGCRLGAYYDSANVLTIGWGHTGPEVVYGLTITQDQADALLQTDIQGHAGCVNTLVTVPINQDQFDALADFVYNEGRGHFLMSTLLKTINANNFTTAANEFLKWDIAGGQVSAGLLRRRQAERELFLGNDWTSYV